VFVAASVWVAARHGHGGWLSHSWLILGLIAVVVVLGAVFYSKRSHSGPYMEPEPDPVVAALWARLDDLDLSDHSSICYRLAEKSSAHQGALDDAMREIEATKIDETEI
jgi:hypothetical protein